MSFIGQEKRRTDLQLVEDAATPSTETSFELAPIRKLAIEARNVSLDYPVGSFRRASIKSTLLSFAGAKNDKGAMQYVRALNDINLRIARGERVALIGHNGSGKSTLLRAMAGIYPITEGHLSAVGNIGTLLEIGLGFELESSGRENIYHRGMTLGYSRKQLREVEAEIIEFSQLGEFIDLPMRTYSSGMFVRLGFAISTQFAPEVLLIDEVFGAGDAGFSMRAIKRMNRIVDESGICVIATHDMGLVEQLCTRAIWLEKGRIRLDGPPAEVAHAFLKAITAD